jgi:mRNA-degrading endonuclease RelE of RelBE toxin-antitoxin system
MELSFPIPTIRLTDGTWIVTIIVIMARRQPYALVYAPAVKQHLQAVERHHYSEIHETLEKQLRFEPGTETRNREPLQQPAALQAHWELRFGPDNRFRVFYEIDRENRQVSILAIGIKERDRLFIGGEEIRL